MAAYLMSAAVGIILLLIGISNLKGNINSIHSYHRHRVSEEDKAAFGKLMGTGMIACSAGIISFGLLAFLSEMLDKEGLMTIGSYATAAGLAIGIAIMFYATIKYNKGVF